MQPLLSGGQETRASDAWSSLFGDLSDGLLSEMSIADATTGAGEDGVSGLPVPTQIHLAKARILGGAGPTWVDVKLRRGRLDHVSGFSFGRLD
jgi:hypothetical protein